MFAWEKLSSAKWEDVWEERLALFSERLAIASLPNAKTIRLAVYALAKSEADLLLKEFGGTVRPYSAAAVFKNPAPHPPLRIRNRLIVVSETAKEKNGIAVSERKSSKNPVRRTLVIPAGMAFGTGEHATTATCLRLLCDAADAQNAPWEMLDLGTGSGILAIAASKLGARKVLAGDFDPNAVRIAKENALANREPGDARVQAQKIDVLDWQPKQRREIITANLFSEILIKSAPQIAAALAADGHLIFSGVLRFQEEEVLAAFHKQGLKPERIVRKGKWIAGVLREEIGKRKSETSA